MGFRLLAIALTSLVFFAALLLVIPITDAAEPRQRVMGQFYLSILLTLLMTYLLYAAGRFWNPSSSETVQSLASRLRILGFPLAHRHAWGDFGRLYALLFLVFVGAGVLSGLITAVATPLVGFEQRVDVSDDGTGLSETEAMRQIATGEIALNPADQARLDQVHRVRGLGLVVGLIVLLPCLVRLLPFFFWRARGPRAPTLAETWAQVPWARVLPFTAGLSLILAGTYVAPIPRLFALAAFTLLFVGWSLIYAKVTKSHG